MNHARWVSPILFLLASCAAGPGVTRDEAEALFIRGYVAYASQDYAASNAYYRPIVESYAGEPIGFIAAYNMACNCARLKDPEEAFRWLKIALVHGYPNLRHIETDEDLSPLRAQKGYVETMDQARKRLELEKPPPAIHAREVHAFARKLADAAGKHQEAEITALFSRAGWFYDKTLPDRLNADLKQYGYALKREARWTIRPLDHEKN